MDKNYLLILSLLLLTLNYLLISEFKTGYQGTIEKIYYSPNRITLYLEEYDIPFIIFTTKIVSIQEGDFVTILGKKNTYKQQEQIIVSKLMHQSRQPASHQR